MNTQLNSIQFEDNTFGYYHLGSVSDSNTSNILILTNNVFDLQKSDYITQLTEHHDVYLSDLQTTPKNKRLLIDPPLTTYAQRIKKLVDDLSLTDVVVISTLEYGAYVLEFLKTHTKVVKHFIGINTPISVQSYTESFSVPIKRKLNASMRQANISMGAGSICYQINDCERILFSDAVDTASLKDVDSQVDLIVNNEVITNAATENLLRALKNSNLTQIRTSVEEELLKTAFSLI